MDAVLLELIESMEVKVNIMDEERKAKALYDQGVKAMRLARGLDASDFSVGNISHVQEIVITGIRKDLKQLKCGHYLEQGYTYDYCPPCLTEMAKKEYS